MKMESPTASFYSAIKQGDLHTVNLLLDQQPVLVQSRDDSGLSAVLTAVYYGQAAITQSLIDHGAPLDIFEACAAGQSGKVISLLDDDSSLVNAWAPDGFQPLGLACFFGHAQIVELLLARGAEVNSPSRNPLNVQPLNSAVAGQHLDIACMLLGHGADVNARQGEGFTPLHGAAQNGQVEMIQLLLQYSADVHARSAAGKTPYDLAKESGHLDMLAFLK